MKLLKWLSGVLLCLLLLCGAAYLLLPQLRQAVDLLRAEPAAEEGQAAAFSDPQSLTPMPLQNHDHDPGVQDMDFGVQEIYITVYPTYNTEGELLTRAAFEKHTALDRSYNPTLDAHIWEGDPADPTDADTRFGFDGPEVNATIRVRGNSSRGFSVKNFKVKLTEEGAKLFGTDSLNFNKHLMDDTRTNNKLACDLLQLVPTHMSSVRTKFIRLYLNDVAEDGSETGFQDQGLYIWVEQPDGDYLKNHGLDSNGTIYKAILFEFRRYPEQIRTTDDPDYDAAVFETVVKPMVNPDHEKLIRMLDAVNDYSRDFREVMDTYFDEDNYLTWMASNILMGNADAVAHNFLLYSRAGSERWYLLPWDYDDAFEYSAPEVWGNRPYQNFGAHVFWAVPFHQRYLRLEGSVEKLSEKVKELYRTVFTHANIHYLNQQYLAVLRDFFAADPDQSMILDFYIGQRLDTLELEGEARETYREDSLWFRVRDAKTEQARYALFFARRVETPMLQRAEAVRNNYERFLLALDSPTPGYIQQPERVDGGWMFRWDAAFDFQEDGVTYELIIARDAALTDRIYHVTDLQANEYLAESLPAGPVYFRVITRDEDGHAQYPLNTVVTTVGGTSRRQYALAGFTVPEG